MANKNESEKQKHIQGKIKKRPFTKLRSGMDNNSQIFFATDKQIDNEHIINESLEKAESKQCEKKSKKKKIFGLLFFIFNVILVVAVFYNFANEQGGIQPLSTLFANKPKWFHLFVALGLYIATVIFNALKFLFLIHSRTKKWRPWFSLKLASIGRYYDLITPMGSGGQPFEIYYLKKDGYTGDISTAIPLAKYMAWQVAFIAICTFILVAYSGDYASSTLVLVCAWVGLILILLLFLFVLFMSITKKWGASLVVGVLKLLHKMHIIKDYKKALIKVLRFVKQYQFCIKTFAKSPWTLISVLISSVGALITNSLIAYFIYISFEANPVVGWWEIVCKCFICELAVSFIPLPGGSGATELSFNALLGSLFTEGTLFWGILIWRFLTYYLYIIQGLIVLMIDVLSKKKKTKKVRNLAQSTESEEILTNTEKIIINEE